MITLAISLPDMITAILLQNSVYLLLSLIQ